MVDGIEADPDRLAGHSNLIQNDDLYSQFSTSISPSTPI
jgi:hypothetical protein